MAKLDMGNIHKKLQEAGSILSDTIGFEQAKEYLKVFDDVEKQIEEKKPKSPTWRRGKAFCGRCGGCLENKEQHSSDIVQSIRFCKWCGTPVDWSNE